MLRTHFGSRLDEDEERSGRCQILDDNRGSIIKTHESQVAGAVFLSAPSVMSRQQCIESCCANYSCTTAVVKEKVG
jgi:MANEC domain